MKTGPSTLLLLVAAVFVAVSPGRAQQAEDVGDYRVHYNVLNTHLLPAGVASAYGIQRSSARALVNIAVLRKNDDDLDTPVRARVEAGAVNLTGQRRAIDMKEIREADAVYYIGTLRVHDEETLNFTIEVTPADTGRTHTITFRRQFYTD